LAKHLGLCIEKKSHGSYFPFHLQHGYSFKGKTSSKMGCVLRHAIWIIGLGIMKKLHSLFSSLSLRFSLIFHTFPLACVLLCHTKHYKSCGKTEFFWKISSSCDHHIIILQLRGNGVSQILKAFFHQLLPENMVKNN